VIVGSGRVLPVAVFNPRNPGAGTTHMAVKEAILAFVCTVDYRARIVFVMVTPGTGGISHHVAFGATLPGTEHCVRSV
jgi:hypothetical protein